MDVKIKLVDLARTPDNLETIMILTERLTTGCKSLTSTSNPKVSCSSAIFFFTMAAEEIAKNLLDPELKITEVTLRVNYTLTQVSLELIDNGLGFPSAIYGKSQDADSILDITGPFATGNTTKTIGDTRGGGCGRGIAQLGDWFEAIGLDRKACVRISKLRHDGGTVLMLNSPIMTNPQLSAQLHQEAYVLVTETFEYDICKKIKLSIAERYKLMQGVTTKLAIKIAKHLHAESTKVTSLARPTVSLPIIRSKARFCHSLASTQSPLRACLSEESLTWQDSTI